MLAENTCSPFTLSEDNLVDGIADSKVADREEWQEG
jgi:hypothetical protein